MPAAPLAVRAWSISTALCLCVACAADAGDPGKVDAGHAAITVDAGGGVDTGSVPGQDSGGGSHLPDAGSPPPGPDAAGIDATSSNDATGGDETSIPEAAADVEAPDVVVPADASGCLNPVPSTCPDCMTQNASDVATCQKYLQCFAANDCNPADACASNDGVCGVNTIGGGEAPLMAATQTYKCACP
jgi:hypothetical protein